MKRIKLRVRETSEVIHIVEVPDDFAMPAEAELDNFADIIGQQDSAAVETLDVQICSVLAAEPLLAN